MLCKCGSKMSVADVVKTEDEIYRKRVCKDCGKVIFTLEFEIEYDENVSRIWNDNYRRNSRIKHSL